MDDHQLKDTLRTSEDHTRSIISEMAKERIAADERFKAFINVFQNGMAAIVSGITKDCVKGTSNEQRIVALERDMGKMCKNVEEIKNGLLGRPTWSVLFIMTFLVSMVGILITFILSGVIK